MGGLMIAAGGGIGGGGMLVPIYILVLGFTAKHAIPLSNVTVLGGACANTLLNAPKRHALPDRPLVDWDLILVMEPLTIAGALVGAFLNKILPELILTVSLVLVLSFTAHSTLKKAFKMYRAENAALRLAGEDDTTTSQLTKLHRSCDELEEEEATESLVSKQHHDDDEEHDDDDDINSSSRSMKDVGIDDDLAFAKDPENNKETTDDDFDDEAWYPSLSAPSEYKKELKQLLEDEKKVPMEKIGVLVAMFVVIVMINILKGGGAFRSPLGIVCGTNGYWFTNAGMLVFIVVVSIFIRSYLVEKHRKKIKVGFPFVQGDIMWDGKTTIIYPLICTIAGFFAGMFGVGWNC